MSCRSPQRTLRTLRALAYVSCIFCHAAEGIEHHGAHLATEASVNADGSLSGDGRVENALVVEGGSQHPHAMLGRQIIRSAEAQSAKPTVAKGPPAQTKAAAAEPTAQSKAEKHTDDNVMFPPRQSVLEFAFLSKSTDVMGQAFTTIFIGQSLSGTIAKVSLSCLLLGCMVLGLRYYTKAGSEADSGSSGAALVDSGDRSIIGALFCAMIWMTLSGTLTLYNAWMFSEHGGNFRHVIVLVCWHFFLNILLTINVRLFFPQLMPAAAGGLLNVDSWHLFQTVMVQALLQCCTLVLGNKAYLYLSVSTIQMIKAGMPLMTYVISCFFGMEQLTRSMLGVIMTIVVGMWMAVTGDLKPSMIGLIFQFASFLIEGVRLVCLRKMVSNHGINLDPLSSLLFYSPICFVSLATLALVTGEFKDALAGGLSALPIQHLLANGFLACSLNVAGVFLLRQASATTLAVCGVLKDLALVGLSIPLFGNTLTPLQIGGLITILVSVRLYNRLKEDPEYINKQLEKLALQRGAEN